MEFSKVFTDTKDRTWDVSITVGTLGRLRDVAGVVLDDLVPKRIKSDSVGLAALAEFLSDSVAILQAVYAVCKPQIDKLGLTFDQFAEGFEGEKSVEVCEKMAQAFLAGLHDFFLRGSPIPQPMRAAILVRALKMGQKLAETEAARSEQVLDRVERKVMATMTPMLSEAQMTELDSQIDGALSKFAGSGLEQSPAILPTAP